MQPEQQSSRHVTAEEVSPFVVDPGELLRDVWRVKHLTRLGVYAAIFVIQPLCYFVFGFSLLEVGIGLAVGLALATAAIEAVFHQVVKLRKRGSYPGALALQLGSAPTLDVACQAICSTVDQLLRLRGSFLTLQKEGGFISLVAISNISRVDADYYLRLGAPCVQQALTAGQSVAFRPDRHLLAEAVMTPGTQIVFVPVQSLRRTIGVMGLIGDKGNPDLSYGELLVALGTAMGVSLESLRQRDDLRTLVAIDELTKVYNRRHFFDQLDREIAACERHSMPLSVLTFDLDGLKMLNDSFGHDLGDEALRTVAQRLVRYSRATDIVCRLGGDEFAVILPRTGSEGAVEIARRLQSSVERAPLVTADGGRLRLSISSGMATYPSDADDPSVLLRTADGKMYAAKAVRVRNRAG